MRAVSLLAACALVVACDNPPPPIGSDAAFDAAKVGDAAGGDGPSQDASQDSGSPCTLTSPPSDPTCAACLQASCCAAANACTANSDCPGYVACIRACYPPDGGTGDSGVVQTDSGETSGFTCVKNCEKQYPNGINEGTALADCENTSCASQCP
jgi:hypothetical protein